MGLHAPFPGERESVTFRVGSFPYHDGPVLVPSLRVGEHYDLTLDPGREGAIRIARRRDLLGYVPPPHDATVRGMLARGMEVRCVAIRVDPAADLAHLLEVRITCT